MSRKLVRTKLVADGLAEVIASAAPAPEPYTPLDLSQIRSPTFSNDKINGWVNEALARMPAENHLVFMAVADGQGPRMAIFIRPDEHWSFAGYIEKPWKGQLEYGVQVLFSI